MKRRISLLLSVLLLISVFPLQILAVSPAEKMTISVENTIAQQDSVAEVAVSVANNPGVASIGFTLTFDENLTLIEASNGSAFSEMAMTPPAQLKRNGRVSGSCRFAWLGNDNVVENGEILKLKFRVSPDAILNRDCLISVSFDNGDILNTARNMIDCAAVSGKVRIVDYMPGDVDNNGKINMMDVLLLCQYYVDGSRYDPDGYAVDIRRESGDVDASGKINMLDVLMLCQYYVDGCRYDPDGYAVKLLPGQVPCDHQLDAVSAVAPTCTEAGNTAYYLCSECGRCYSDASASTEITLLETILPAKGHTVVIDPAVPADYEHTGLTEGSHCSVCHEVLAKQEVVPKLYAEQHSVTYHITNGDSYLSSKTIENPNPGTYYTSNGLTLKNVSVPGYVFLGWYDLPAGANAENIKKIPAGSTDNYELYAHWEKVTYSVDFEYPTQYMASLISMDEVTYTVDKGVVLPTPQLEGYIFAGWSDEDGTIIRSIPAGSTGNKKYTANWVSKRNQAWTKTELDDPIIIEDPASGTILFTYEVGEIRNVPSYVIEDFGYINANGITKTVTKTFSTTVSESLMKSYTNTVSNATVNSYGWTLSNEWTDSTTVDEEWCRENGLTKEEAEAYCKSDTSGWYVSNGKSGSNSSQTLSSSDEYNMNASSYNSNFNGGTYNSTTTAANEKNETKWNVDVGVEASVPIKVVKLEGSVGVNFSNTHSTDNSSTSFNEETHNYNIACSNDTQSGSSQHLEASCSNSSSWNNDFGYNGSATTSSNSSISQAISESISEKYGYGKTYIGKNGESSTQGLSTTAASEDSYSSSVTYSTSRTAEQTVEYTTSNTMSGYHRWIMADTAHVFAVVGYDIASSSYFVNTYSVMENNLKPYEDYSCSTGNYNDNQNSFIRFEVPYDTIVEYVINRVGESDGLEVNASGVITGYHGTDTYVVIPEYKVVDNQDGTKKVIPVTGISETAFRGNQNIVGVNMSTYIDAIPNNAFRGCTALTEVQSCATSIGAYAFDGCTSMKAVDLGYGVKAIGQNAFTNVQTITLYAINESVVDAVIHSGAKRISLYITDRCASLDNRTLEIPSSVEYFAFYGAGKTYNDLRILSDAAHTVINRVTINASAKTPIQISSPTVELNQVTVNASGIGLILSADTCALNLYGESYITSASGNALLCKNPVLHQVNAGYYSKLHVNKDALVCGTVTNGTYLECSGKIVTISAADFDKYVLGTLSVHFDANGGSVSTSDKTAFFGQAYGTLPMATRSQYGFDGWYTAKSGGTKITENTSVEQIGAVTLYAHWKVNAYTATWNGGTGYTITVKRTSSPNQGASIGNINSGTAVYYGDVLSITYTKADHYTLKTTGKTSITVTGNVTASDIYATAELVAYTASWNGGTGYTITVKRTSSPKKGASIGNISSGAAIYYGDVLSITYTKADYYTLKTPGKTSITVSGNVTASDIYATAELNPLLGWEKAANVPAGARIEQTKWNYTLTSYTTSGSSSLSGWTKYDTKRTSWGTTQGPVYNDPSNGSRNVWSEQYETGRTHYYRYYRYANSSGSAGSYSQSSTYYNYEQIDLTYALTESGSYGGYKYWYNGTNYHTYWYSSEWDNVSYGTRWYYQEPVYTYYYKKTENKETTTGDPTGQANVSNVVKYVMYRAK